MLSRLWAACFLLAFLLSCSSPAPEQPRVILGQIDVSIYDACSGVIEEVLQRLDCSVELRKGPHETIFPALGRGEIDLLVAALLPEIHGHYWEQYQSQALRLGKLFDGIRLIWAVPSFVSGVDSVEALTLPEVARRMEKVIWTSGAGSGLTRRSRQMMSEYGLLEAGYRLEAVSQQEYLEQIRRIFQEGSWSVIPGAQPRFLSRAYDLRVLEEPRGLLGESNEAYLVAHREVSRRLPQSVLEVLQRVSLGREAVEEIDYWLVVEGMERRDAARRWMAAHPERVESWFSGPQ